MSTQATLRPLGPGVIFAEKYTTVRRLGAGGMADVYEVEHAVTRRRLALKLLRPEVSGTRVNVERFYREASVCAGIDSDHIVQIIDCDVDKSTGIPFIVMELLQGKDLSAWIREAFDSGAPPPTSLVLTLLKQVASALDKVHARGIVHRDLKPANLFLTFPSDGPPRVKILDFGVARLDTDTDLSAPTKIGTPLYMSSEQLRAQDIGPAADIWALALITFELLVGVPYWQGNTASTLFARIPDREAHPQPSTLAARHNVTLPRAFDLWLLRCIDPDPSQRPSTAGSAVGELLRIFDPKATQPPSPPSGTEARPPRPVAERSSGRPVPPRGRVSRAVSTSRVPPATPQIPLPGEERERDLDPDDIEDLTATAELNTNAPRKVVSRLRNLPGALTTRMEPVRRDGTPQSQQPQRPSASTRADEAVTQELPVAQLHSRLTPTDDQSPPIVVPPSAVDSSPAPAVVDSTSTTDSSPSQSAPAAPPAPPPVSSGPSVATSSHDAAPRPSATEEVTDILAAKVSAVLESDAPVERRRIPKAMELQATAILPAMAPAPEVRPRVLVLATVGTLALVGTAAWALMRKPPVPVAQTIDDGIWRGPSPSERVSFGEILSTWSGALRQRVNNGRGIGSAQGEAPTGIDTAAGFTALMAAHRSGVALPGTEQVSLLLALDRFRSTAGWTLIEGAHGVRPSARATAWALMAYSAMAQSSRAPAALERVRVARASLVAFRQADGVSERYGPGAAVDVEATVYALDAFTAAESADSATPRADRDVRAALVDSVKRWMSDANHVVVRDARLHDMAIGALWAAGEGDSARNTRVSRWVDDVSTRASALDGATSPAWLPSAITTLGTVLRAPGRALTESDRRRLSSALEESLRALVRARGELGRAPTEALSEAVLAAVEVSR